MRTVLFLFLLELLMNENVFYPYFTFFHFSSLFFVVAGEFFACELKKIRTKIRRHFGKTTGLLLLFLFFFFLSLNLKKKKNPGAKQNKNSDPQYPTTNPPKKITKTSFDVQTNACPLATLSSCSSSKKKIQRCCVGVVCVVHVKYQSVLSSLGGYS